MFFYKCVLVYISENQDTDAECTMEFGLIYLSSLLLCAQRRDMLGHGGRVCRRTASVDQRPAGSGYCHSDFGRKAGEALL